MEDELEVSTMALLAEVAENLKLLIVAPLVIGLAVWAAVYSLPPRFVSQSVVDLRGISESTASASSTTNTAERVGTPWVLAQVNKSLNLYPGQSVAAASQKLADRIKFVPREDGVFQLEVTGESPVEAQTIAKAILDSWIASTLPREPQRVELELRLAEAQDSRNLLGSFLAQFASGKPAGVAYFGDQVERPSSIVSAFELKSRYFNEVIKLKRELEGLPRDVIRLPPSLPVEPSSSRRWQMAVTSAFCVGFALLFWILTRRAWLIAGRDAKIAKLQSRIRAALGFRPGVTRLNASPSLQGETDSGRRDEV